MHGKVLEVLQKEAGKTRLPPNNRQKRDTQKKEVQFLGWLVSELGIPTGVLGAGSDMKF